VKIDASDYAVATILSITHPDNEIHPIAFHSHTLHSSELNYDIHDKELLAIFETFQIWHYYLEGPFYLLMFSLITRIWNIFPLPSYSPDNKPSGTNIFLCSILLFDSIQVN
jgi:hypothetical protein